MKPNFYPNLNKMPRSVTALIATGSLALAACGSTPERVSNETAATTPTPANTKSHKSKPKQPKATPVPTEVASEDNSGNSVSDLIETMVEHDYGGGTIHASKDETAGEAILDGIKGIEDELSTQAGVTYDQVETVVNNAAPEQVLIIKKDYNLPEEQWPRITLSDNVKNGDDFTYQFVTE